MVVFLCRAYQFNNVANLSCFHSDNVFTTHPEEYLNWFLVKVAAVSEPGFEGIPFQIISENNLIVQFRL